MSHELYYTSAPEGLKRGASGFCTVAATEGLPRMLGDRLESLSAYRHHFAAGSGENPVSFAHCVVNVSGTAYHVLSRICDAGVDHTQRTNAFAHHLVVGAREMAAAGGGPAWMLRQSGVMFEHWDGHVGSLPQRTLPMGGGGSGNAGGGVCRLWKEATGDAGWGGRLAESFVAGGGGMPVCILFEPGRDMLPLLAEAIALLPPELRWGVTFNTYFTTMPTSAACLWRCCLAGTPAAQSGVRYAGAGGLVIDLTAGNLGAAPGGAGSYVEYARTGRGRPASAAAGSKKAVGVTATRSPAAQDSGAYDLAEPDEPAAPETPLDEPPPSELPAPSPRRRRKAVDVGVLEEITGRASSAAESRRRKQVLLLFGGALLAIAAGMAVVWLSARNLTPPAESLTPAYQPPASQQPPQPQDTAQHADVHLPSLAPPLAVSPASAPITPTPQPPDAPEIPVTLLPDDLAAPVAGTGMHDPAQSWKLPDLAPAAAKNPVLTLKPLGGTPWIAKGAGGTMIVDPESLAPPTAGSTNAPAEARLRWQDADAPAGTAWTAATVALDTNQLTVTWNAGFMLTHPEAVPTVYWRLRAGEILRRAGAAPAARYAFRPWESADIDFTQESATLDAPVPFPEEASVLATNLPAGWQQQASGGAGGGGAATRPGLADAQIIIIRKPGEDATATAEFELLFHQGLTDIASTYAQKRQAAEQALADAQDDWNAATQAATQPGAASGKDAPPQKAALAAQLARYKQAVAGYNELEHFRVAVMLGANVRVGTIRFARPAPASQPSSQPATR